jgi:hypothetical protein
VKITKRQLRRIIREAIDPREFEAPLGGWVGNALTNDPDYSAPPGEEDYYAPGGEGEQATDAQLKKGWTSWLEERGLEFEDLDDLALAAGAPNRTWLDSAPPYDGFIGPLNVEVWVKDMQAAKEILSTRLGGYKGTMLPGGKKINESGLSLNEDLSSFLTLGLTKAAFILLAHYGLKSSKEKASALRDVADEIEGAGNH